MRSASRRFLILCIALVSIASIIFASLYMPSTLFVVRAEAYHLYAATCLGGWENTHLAAGAPEIGARGEAPVFTEENSARLNANTPSQIYCGEFSGDILENTIPKKILVKFSWAAEYPATPAQDTGTSTAEIIEAGAATSTEENVENTAEQSVAEEPAPLENPSFPTGSALSGAQESASEAETADNGPQETIQEPAPEAPITPESESNVPPAEATDTVATAPVRPDGLLEVLYTLDSVEWKSLGLVAKDEFGSKYFEIPISEASKWEDISKIQIGIQSVPVIDSIAPIIYLDAVWLEVEYQRQEEEPYTPSGEKEGDVILSDEITVQQQVDEESLLEEESSPDEEGLLEEVASPPQEPTPPPKPPLKERILNKDFRIAQKAAYRCDAENFRIDISGRISAQARILLGGKEVQLGELEIGSLPIGVDILFSQNRDYLHEVSQNDSAFDLEIVNQEGSQKGSFSIPILYTDRESNQITICQINIINY
jgi:hypothetical protein